MKTGMTELGGMGCPASELLRFVFTFELIRPRTYCQPSFTGLYGFSARTYPVASVFVSVRVLCPIRSQSNEDYDQR
jgi:hypothetical protein